MDLKKKVSLIIYRFQEKGLEVFLVNDPEEQGRWTIPEGPTDDQPANETQDRYIELDPVRQDNGHTEEAIAVEGDWHDIPSLKGMIYEDAIKLKETLKEVEKGGFFALKDAFKKLLPHQYEFLKELKDILVDRNSVRDL